jgi:hypothetical protein
MATTAEFIGVYIVDIITTATITGIAITETITIIAATIITITAIGETYRVVAVSKLALRRARVAAHAAAFSLFRPRPLDEARRIASNIAKLPALLAR